MYKCVYMLVCVFMCVCVYVMHGCAGAFMCMSVHIPSVADRAAYAGQ